MTLLLALLLSCSDKGDPADGGAADGGGGDGGGGTDGGTGDGGKGDGGDTGPVEVDWSLYTVTADIARQTLTADGWSETTVALQVLDAKGQPPPDGQALPLVTSRGTIVDLTGTHDGVCTATVRAGTWPGTGTLSFLDAPVLGEANIEMVPGTPVSVQLHLHGSLSEGGGLMREHIVQAERTGVHVIWWTDHDQLMYRNHSFELTGYDFESGSLVTPMGIWPPPETRDVAWLQVTSGLQSRTSTVTAVAAQTGNFGWRLSGNPGAAADWKEDRYRLDVSPRLNFKPLLAQVDFAFAFRPQSSGADVEVEIAVPLSATRAGEGEGMEEPHHTIHFVWSQTDATHLNSAFDHYVMMSGVEGSWSELGVDLSALAEEAFPTVGLDLHAEFVDVAVRARNGATVAVDLDDFTWSQVIVGDDLVAAQRDFLAKVPTDVVQLVGNEISWVPEGHLNAFGSEVPLLPYDERDDWIAETAVDWVHEHGGIVSQNHMFGVTGELMDEVERLAMVDEVSEELLERDVYGCDLIEVGYRRRGGELQNFLTVWDNLGILGRIITGEGGSDIHGKQPWTMQDNNFVTWVVGDSPTEEQLIHNLRRGAAFFGESTYFENGAVTVDLTVPDHEAGMGQVVVGATEPTRVVFTAEPMTVGWQVRAVEDGVVTATWDIEPVKGVADDKIRFEARHTVEPKGGKLVRFEVWRDEADETVGVVFTNPIYFLDSAEGVAPERLPVP